MKQIQGLLKGGFIRFFGKNAQVASTLLKTQISKGSCGTDYDTLNQRETVDVILKNAGYELVLVGEAEALDSQFDEIWKEFHPNTKQEPVCGYYNAEMFHNGNFVDEVAFPQLPPKEITFSYNGETFRYILQE